MQGAEHEGKNTTHVTHSISEESMDSPNPNPSPSPSPKRKRKRKHRRAPTESQVPEHDTVQVGNIREDLKHALWNLRRVCVLNIGQPRYEEIFSRLTEASDKTESMLGDQNFMDLHGANIEDNTIHMRHATEGLYEATARFHDEARRVDAGLESYLQLFEDYTQSQRVMRETVRFYREGAELGHVDAQFLLGCSYEKGEGIEKDMKEAVRWYRLAAEQGHARAQFMLGYSYEKGEGIEKDMKEAVRWYRLAAEQGDVGGQQYLSYCYRHGMGVEKDVAEATRLGLMALGHSGAASSWLVSRGCRVRDA
jgi:hypothetical protein